MATQIEGPIDSCVLQSLADGYRWTPSGGINVFKIPYTYCIDKCGAVKLNPAYDILFVVVQFVLPVLIFSTAIARRLHLDLPTKLLVFEHGRIFKVIQIPAITVALMLIKTVDLLLWVVTILMFAGPIVSSSVQEMILDYRVLHAMSESSKLAKTSPLSQKDRLELLVALLCGSFEDESGDARSKIQKKLRIQWQDQNGQYQNQGRIHSVKTQLRVFMTSQPGYGAVVGLPTLFFAGGFLYNALLSSDLTVGGDFYVKFAIWWLIPVFVAVACGAVLSGSNPSCLSALISESHNHDWKSWGLVRNIYKEEVYPVWVWDRGLKKLEWIANSRAWQLNWFKDKVKLGYGSWFIIITASVVTILVPNALASTMDFLFQHPAENCSTLAYVMYSSAQIWLIMVSGIRTVAHKRYSILFRPRFYRLVPRSRRRIARWPLRGIEALWVGSVYLLTTAALLSVFVTSFAGNIGTLLGLCNNCLCQTPLRHWALPASQRTTIIAYANPSLTYTIQKTKLANGLSWAISAFILLVCFIGWLYQRLIRTATMQQIRSL